jgi:hypothetical protein
MWKIRPELLDPSRIEEVGDKAFAYKEAGFHCSESTIRAVWSYVIPIERYPMMCCE